MVIENARNYLHLLTHWGVLEYPLEYASIRRVQKICQVHFEGSNQLPGSSTICLYVILFQTKSIAHFFYLHAAYQTDIDTYINYLQVARSRLVMFQACLSKQYLV